MLIKRSTAEYKYDKINPNNKITAVLYVFSVEYIPYNVFFFVVLSSGAHMFSVKKQ